MSLSSRLAQLVDLNYGTGRGFVRCMLGEIEYLLGRVQVHTQPDLKGVRRLVFVCLGNINRSAFGEQVARSQCLSTCSFGLSTTTGSPAFHKAVMTAGLFGHDLALHRATDMSDYQFAPGDLLLAMEIRHVRRLVARGIPAQSIALLGHWASPHRIHLHDPHVLSDAYFRTCFTLIESAVHALANDLRAAGSPCVGS